MSKLITIAVISFLILSSMRAQANPFADAVVSYNPGPGQFVSDPMYNDPSKCLGAPKGLSVYAPDNSSVTTLGDGGYITLKFNSPIYDNPKNPYGLDFIVFSNTQFTGSAYLRWQELAFVEISPNGTDWYLILPSILPADLVGGVDTGTSSTVVSGYAEYTPALPLPSGGIRTNEEFYTAPDRQSVPGNSSLIAIDAASGGGDAFDIAKAVREVAPGVPQYDGQGNVIPARIASFQYIRITDAVTGDYLPDLGEISAEIDAVSEIHPSVAVGEAKSFPVGSYTAIAGAVVTARFTGEFFIESPDRSAAIKVTLKQSVKPGDQVTVTGHILKTGGVFKLPDPLITITSSGSQLTPLGMPVRSLGGSAAYGLLVRTWGKVTDPGDGTYCIISDGASSVKVVFSSSCSVTAGSYLSLTGICDREEGSGAAIIRVSDLNGIVTNMR